MPNTGCPGAPGIHSVGITRNFVVGPITVVPFMKASLISSGYDNAGTIGYK